MFHPPHELKSKKQIEQEEEEGEESFSINNRKFINNFKNNLSSTSSTSSLSSSSREMKLINKISQRKQRGIFNPTIISTVIILYLLPSPSIMTFLNSKGRIINNTIEQSNSIIHRERTLFSFVEASPAPEPAASRSKTSSSTSHRIPPMNGSIFGKRSLENINKKVENSINENNHDDNRSGANNKVSSRLNSNLVKEIKGKQKKQQQQQQVWPNYGESENKHIYDYKKVQRPNTISSHENDKTVPINYKDIITDIIEDFLASNNESDPEETSVAFCRMIVYECTKMLSARKGFRGRQTRTNNRDRGIGIDSII